ncbi:MAG: hypothetical protein Q8R40_06045 [bacterium]|nr:hypothetical protein [bacterium]
MSDTVALETIILEAHDDDLFSQIVITREWPDIQLSDLSVTPEHSDIKIASHATRSGVHGTVYDAWRLGLTTACADVVLVQEREGRIQVPFIWRKNPPFANCWWIMGGAIFNFRPIQQFLLYKIFAEGGMQTGTFDEFLATHQIHDRQYSAEGIHIVGPLGVYRTAAEDTDESGKVCDTINLCYMGTIPSDMQIRHDDAHKGVRWCGITELNDLGHWYPEHVAKRALHIYERATYNV